MLNNVTLQGRLVASPELRHTNNGIPVTSFLLAVERTYVKDGNKTADFIECVAWKQTAEFVCKYFHKGNGMCLDGSLQTRVYDDQQSVRHAKTEVVVNHVFFPIRDKKEHDDAKTAPIDDSNDFSEVIVDTEDLPF